MRRRLAGGTSRSSGESVTSGTSKGDALRKILLDSAIEAKGWIGRRVGDSRHEGHIDLLYRDDGGLVVVDYKTDAWSTEAGLTANVERKP